MKIYDEAGVPEPAFLFLEIPNIGHYTVSESVQRPHELVARVSRKKYPAVDVPLVPSPLLRHPLHQLRRRITRTYDAVPTGHARHGRLPIRERQPPDQPRIRPRVPHCGGPVPQAGNGTENLKRGAP